MKEKSMKYFFEFIYQIVSNITKINKKNDVLTRVFLKKKEYEYKNHDIFE